MRMLEAFKWMEDNPRKIMIDCNRDSHRFNNGRFELQAEDGEWGTEITDIESLYEMEFDLPTVKEKEKDQFDLDFEPLLDALTKGLEILEGLAGKKK